LVSNNEYLNLNSKYQLKYNPQNSMNNVEKQSGRLNSQIRKYFAGYTYIYIKCQTTGQDDSLTYVSNYLLNTIFK